MILRFGQAFIRKLASYIMEYELLFIISLDNEEKIEEIKHEIEKTIADLGGKVLSFTDIGKRKFAYPIKHQTHGFYSYARFKTDDNSVIAELNRRISLNGKVMRHLIVRASEIGKPVVSPEAERLAEQPTAPGTKTEPPTKEKKEIAEKAKASMDELDKKLDELLEESPK